MTEGTLLAEGVGKYQRKWLYLATSNRRAYSAYRLDWFTGAGWDRIYDIKLDAYYRSADL